MKTQSQIKLNPFVYFLLMFVVSAYVCDLLSLSLKIFSVNIDYVIPWLIMLLLIPLYLIFRKIFIITKIKYPIVVVVIAFVIIIISFIKIPIPDQSFDTINYHLLLQQNRFIDSINQNFFPSGVQSYLFFLSDTVYYVFRQTLGYRLGTILNSFLLIIINYQIIDIVDKYLKKTKKYKFHSAVFLITFLSICSVYLLANIGIYLVDLIALPFVLYTIKKVIFDSDLSIKNVYFIAFLTGISIALKTTFGIFIAPLLMYILIKNFKKLPKKIIIISLFVPLFINLPYLIYIYWSTGNPFFPLFNSLFHSDYYNEINLINQNSPKTLLEHFLWPILILFDSKKLLLQINFGRLLLGYALSLIILLLHLTKLHNFDKYLIRTAFVFVSFYLIWSFGNGYLRYGLILEVLSAIVFFLLVLYLIHAENILARVFAIMLSIVFVIQSAYSIQVLVFKSNEWSWRSSPINNAEKYYTNIYNIFSDYNQKSIPESIEQADLIATISYNSGYSVLMGLDKPLFSFVYNSQETNNFKQSKQNFLNKIKDKKIVLIDVCDYDSHTNRILENYNYQIEKSDQFNLEVLNKPLCAYSLEQTE